MAPESIHLTEDGAVRRNAEDGPGYRTPTYRRDGGPGLGVMETWRALKRRRWTIFAITILGTLLGLVAVLQATPKYAATSTVMLDPRKANVVDFDEVLSGLPADDDTVNSEILVIRSPLLVSEVARKLNLAARPEFNERLRDGGGLGGMFSLTALAEMFGRPAPPPRPPEAELSGEHSEVTDAILENLTVSRSGRSRAIDIRFTSADPAISAQMVNALADAYLVDQLDAKYEATQQAQQYLNARVAELRDRVQEAERAIEEYRIDAGLIGTSAGTVAAQQLSGLNTQLILFQTQRAEAEARLRQVRQLAAGGVGGPESATEVLDSPLIVELRGRETEAERKIAELNEEYGERHPRMIAARAELRDIQGRIRAEVAKIVASLENEVAVARAREATLATNVRALEQTAASQGAAEVQVRALEREADAARALFEQFLTRASETETQTDIQRPDARVLARADVPTAPAYPKPGVILPIAAALSLFAGIAVALLLEQMDRGYRSGEEVERETGMPVLALTPLIPRRRRLGAAPERYVLDRPTSSFAESLRSIDTGIRLSNVDRTPKSVMITSSVPKEGKSTLSMALGRMLAKSGRRVLLIDADLRRPRVAKALDLPRRAGLIEALSTSADYEDLVQVDQASGMFVLAAGGDEIASPPDLLGSEQMRQLLRRAEAAYDLVILDSAPVLVVSDSRALARHVDSVVFIVRWASTRQEVVQTAFRQLRDAGARIAGVVLEAVNVRRHSQYGYGDSGYYYGAARRYYRD